MDSWTLKALALRPTSNIQGGHYFLNFRNDRLIARFTWTALQIPTRIQKLVWRLIWRSPIALRVLDRLRLEVPDAKQDNDKVNDDYLPGEDYDNDDGDDDDDNGGMGNGIDC